MIKLKDNIGIEELKDYGFLRDHIYLCCINKFVKGYSKQDVFVFEENKQVEILIDDNHEVFAGTKSYEFLHKMIQEGIFEIVED